MGTTHRRIAVVRDQELDAALRRAARQLGEDKPAATLVRELALRGAETIAERPGDEIVRRLVAEHRARPAEGSLLDFVEERGELGPVDQERHASKLVEALRSERVP